MEYPSLLPLEKFDFLKEAEDDEDVLYFLEDEPEKLLLFFEFACEDLPWINRNKELMKGLLKWFTNSYMDSMLSSSMAEKATKIIQAHFAVLESNIPKDILIEVDSEMTEVNSLLFGMLSSTLDDLVHKECAETGGSTLVLDGGSSKALGFVLEYAQTGKVEKLWKLQEKEVLKSLEEFDAWGVSPLVKMAANILVRYINKANVYPMLKMSMDRGFVELQSACIEFLNEHLDVCEFRLLENSLEMTFKNFLEKTFDVFHKLKEYITHIAVSRELPVESGFSELMALVPALQGLDLSETTVYTERFKDIPSSVEELNLSMCSWLNDEYFRLFVQLCPRVRVLTMKSVSQISHRGWAALIRYDALEELYLDRCFQIKDDDFKIISQSSVRLTHLSLDGCDKITDRAFMDFCRRAVKLVQLNVSRTSIANEALIDIVHRCKKLKRLNITRCLNINDKGVVEICRFESLLEYLDISGCSISEGAVKRVKELRPRMQLIAD